MEQLPQGSLVRVGSVAEVYEVLRVVRRDPHRHYAVAEYEIQSISTGKNSLGEADFLVRLSENEARVVRASEKKRRSLSAQELDQLTTASDEEIDQMMPQPALIPEHPEVSHFIRKYRATHCWSCHRAVDESKDRLCEKCGWIICAACRACGCGKTKI